MIKCCEMGFKVIVYEEVVLYLDLDRDLLERSGVSDVVRLFMLIMLVLMVRVRVVISGFSVVMMILLLCRCVE